MHKVMSGVTDLRSRDKTCSCSTDVSSIRAHHTHTHILKSLPRNVYLHFFGVQSTLYLDPSLKEELLLIRMV